MPDRLTDERLREMEMEAAAARALLQYVDLPSESREVLRLYADGVPALIAEVRRLRRVAKAAERDVADARAACGHFADVPRCYSAPYDRTCSDCPYDVVYRTDIALAEWRRVREGEA